MSSIYDLDTPTLLVDNDRLERNIAEMAARAAAGGKALRPHTKTHKTPEIARMQLAAGASGLTVAKLGEAEVLAYAGCKDIFIANQLVGWMKVQRLMALLEHAKVRVGADSMEVAGPIGVAAKSHGWQVPVMIEVDTGLGRSGTRSLEEALLLARQITDQPGLEFLGIFTHEGHLYRGKEGGVDAEAAAAVATQMRETASALRDQGTPCREVSVGSTPGSKLLAPEPGLTELRPGVYVFNDCTQVRRGVEPDRCALTVLATVISVRPDGRVVIDAGTKSFASDNPFAEKTYGEVLDHPELTFSGISEEHGHLQAEGAISLKVGDKIRVVPNHACTCVNMHNSLTTFRGESVADTLYIAGRGKIR
jgi:D-serine deaminase-like pyridoxal phosphate-dependent protein